TDLSTPSLHDALPTWLSRIVDHGEPADLRLEHEVCGLDDRDIGGDRNHPMRHHFGDFQVRPPLVARLSPGHPRKPCLPRSLTVRSEEHTSELQSRENL